jgi:hypothetical protein
MTYGKAIKLAPKDPRAKRNMSAAFFECGQYTDSLAFAQKALELIQQTGGDDIAAQVQQLEARIGKAELHSAEVPSEAKRQRMAEIGDELPRYHPSR